MSTTTCLVNNAKTMVYTVPALVYVSWSECQIHCEGGAFMVPLDPLEGGLEQGIKLGFKQQGQGSGGSQRKFRTLLEYFWCTMDHYNAIGAPAKGAGESWKILNPIRIGSFQCNGNSCCTCTYTCRSIYMYLQNSVSTFPCRTMSCCWFGSVCSNNTYNGTSCF